ncbi:hypothetical protein EON81_10720 [bacterium]|nr:MAG: hypothetical protein EON81_10720 [bacterium]
MNTLPLREILLAAKDAVAEGWGLNVHLGWPQTPTALPYAVVFLMPVARDFDPAQGVESKVRIGILGRWLMPGVADDPVEIVKADRMNEMVAAFQTGPDFAGVGYLPIVTALDPRDAEDLEKGAFQVGVTFECRTGEDHS